MSEVITNKYLSLDGLRKYDGLIKDFIASGDKVLADAIAALTNKIGSLEFEGSDDKTVAEIIDDIYSSIADIVEKQGSLDAKDVEIEGKINGIIGDLESLEGSDAVMTLVTISNKLKALDDANVVERLSAVEKTVADLGKIEGGESLGDIVNKVNANAEAIATLKGEGEGSVKKTAADAAAAALADAKEYADGLVKDAEGNALFDAAGSAAAAQAAAEATAAADATAKADAALADAKEYADDLVKDEEGNVKFDAAGSAAAAQSAAEATAAADATAKADAAKDAAIADAAEKYQVKGDYEAAGAAAQALADAKADAASLYQVKGDYEAAGTAAGLNAAMDERVVKLEAIDHEKLAADASAAAVAAIVAGAESDFDTLKEVEEWIGAHKEGAAELQTTVSGHTDSINTLSADLSTLDTKVDQDIANLTDHMSAAATALEEVDGRLDVLEVFVESHDVITDDDIDALFA